MATTVINRVTYFNIGGGRKQCSSLYMNSGGSRKTISSAYANIGGSRNQIYPYNEITEYMWKRYGYTTGLSEETVSSISVNCYCILSLCDIASNYDPGYNISGINKGFEVHWNEDPWYSSGSWSRGYCYAFAAQTEHASQIDNGEYFYVDTRYKSSNGLRYSKGTLTAYSGSLVVQTIGEVMNSSYIYVYSTDRNAYPDDGKYGSYYYVFVS